jgi:WD40 repeat protein/tRNA A-37 threonylcarbamoyl transferase component Bud32
MSDATPSRPGADRNLLFGILALQMDFIGRDQLIAAMHAWVLEKARPLGQVLVEQQALKPDERDAIEALVGKHLERHGGDMEKSLAAVNAPPPLRHDLQSLADGDVQASLARLPTPTGACAGPAPSTVPESTNTAGRRYQVLRPHGQGGLGEVFVALDQELRREVALKEIRLEHADDPHSRGRFVREAEITGGLEHPGIVPVHGLGQYADGRPFYAMRFIQGETLKEAIASYHAGDGSWTLRALLTRFVAVCNTVAYAHSRGVLHRDLKPANVMLGRYGETLLVDWGLAKPLGESAGRVDGDATVAPALVPGLVDGIETQAGAALGTPAYMSPEQASGRIDQLGPASDIYGLGATLYTLLTGRPPVEGKDTIEVLRKAQRGEWLPPRRVKADVPPALDAVCRKALGLRPEQRHATALELAADVERWLADEPVTAYAEPWAARSRRWMRRHRALVSTAVGVLIVALLGTAVGLLLVSDARDKEAEARKTAEDKAEEVSQQKDKADRRREEARFNQYVAQMNLVQRDYEANNFARVRELLDAQVPREPGARDYRDFEWHYWHRMSHRELLTLQGHTESVTLVSYSPDGRRLASADGGWTVMVWDAATGQKLLTFEGGSPLIRGVTFSPDGLRLATCGPNQIVRVWDAASGQALPHPGGENPHVAICVSYSPDGRRLATAGDDGTVRVWDAASGQELRSLKGQGHTFACAVYSPDGRRLAGADYDKALHVLDTAGGQELLTLKGHTGAVYDVAYSPDGRRLASADTDGMVRVWDATGGQEVIALKPSGWVGGMAFSPDGRRLACGGEDGVVRVWEVAGGQELVSFKGHTGEVLGVSYSPDGRRLASAGNDGTVRVWDAASGQELLILRGHTNTVSCVAYSPDGQRLATACDDETVRVWDAASGQELLTLKGHTAPVRCVSYSPDGRRLASAGNEVRVWDAAGGQELLTLKKGVLVACAYSPDGRRLASAGSDGAVWVWDAASGEELLTLDANSRRVEGGLVVPGWRMTFSPDGRRLALAGRERAVQILDATSGKELLTLKGHKGQVSCVAYSPDGRRLATAGSDGTVRVWDAEGGQELLSLKGHTGGVFWVAYGPDGRQLASAGKDKTVRVWEALSVPAEVRRQRALVSDVHALFARGLLREEVLAALRKEPTLNEPDREFALQVAQTQSGDPRALYEAAWAVVKSRDAGKDAYTAALHRAEAAVRLAPGDMRILNALGVAHYRVGDWAKALETLEQSEKNSARCYLAYSQRTWPFWRWRTTTSATRSRPGPCSAACGT